MMEEGVEGWASRCCGTILAAYCGSSRERDGDGKLKVERDESDTLELIVLDDVEAEKEGLTCCNDDAFLGVNGVASIVSVDAAAVAATPAAVDPSISMSIMVISVAQTVLAERK